MVGATAAIEALIERSKADVTFDIDISLTQYNIWFYRLGLYSQEQQKDLRARDPEFCPRHFDDVPELIAKTHKSVLKIRPDILSDPKMMVTMTGAEYDLQEDISVVAPAFAFEKSKIEYAVPTGKRGRSRPEWTQ